jgi:hypothetical protein
MRFEWFDAHRLHVHGCCMVPRVYFYMGMSQIAPNPTEMFIVTLYAYRKSQNILLCVSRNFWYDRTLLAGGRIIIQCQFCAIANVFYMVWAGCPAGIGVVVFVCVSVGNMACALT